MTFQLFSFLKRAVAEAAFNGQTGTSCLGPPSYGASLCGDSISAMRPARCFATAYPSGGRIMVL